MKPIISICIPTYNRSRHLSNCLNSIILNKNISNLNIQICVSDNCSTDDTEKVVRLAQREIDIEYQKNEENIGMSRNFLNVVNMARGEFVWLIGDDDLLMPSALIELEEMIDNNPGVDFFYTNSFHLTTEEIFSYPQPFDTKFLPIKMDKFSSWKKKGQMDFLELINPKISFDFLGGIFLYVFKRDNWLKNSDVLDNDALYDVRVFSHFDNTFPQIKIFAKGFSQSKAYFNPNPLSVCLSGAREWAPMYPLIRSIRLLEALNEYRKNGLPYIKYCKYRNIALSNFIPDLVYMAVHKNQSGYKYIKPLNLILSNCLYPRFYWSFLNYLIRKTKKLFTIIF